MARSRSTKNKSSAESSDGQRDWGQVLGLVYLGLGVLIFVALLTYDRSDLSSNTVPPNPVIQNWIGPFGAIVGKGLFFFLEPPPTWFLPFAWVSAWLISCHF